MKMLVFDETYEEMKPKLQKDLLGFLDTFTLKHATIPEQFKVSFKQFKPHRQDFYSIDLHDVRYPDRDPVGRVCLDFGRLDNEFDFEVQSRLIRNAKYSQWSREHHTVRTKDVKKAIKSALTYIKPWGYEELMMQTKDAVERVHRKWVEEKQNSTYNMRPNHDAMYLELKNLIAQGVIFVTPEFKTAVEILPEYEEYRHRQHKKVNMTCIMFTLGKTVVSDGKTTNEFASEDLLNEYHKSRIGLLKLIDNAQLMPEIGYKVDANTFWIYNETNN